MFFFQVRDSGEQIALEEEFVRKRQKSVFLCTLPHIATGRRISNWGPSGWDGLNIAGRMNRGCWRKVHRRSRWRAPDDKSIGSF